MNSSRLLIPLIPVFCCLILLTSIGLHSTSAQTPSPISPVPTETFTPSPSQVSNNSFLDQYMQTFSDLNDRVLDSTDRVLSYTFATTIGIALFVVFSVVTIFLNSRTIGAAKNAAERSRTEAEQAKSEATNAKVEAANAKASSGSSAKSAQESQNELQAMSGKVEEQIGQLTKLKQNLEDVDKRSKTIEHTIKTISRLELFMDIEYYALNIYNSDIQHRQNALWKLVQYSQDSSPVARRECVHVFSTIPDYPEFDVNTSVIIERLKELASPKSEAVEIIRLDARRALRKFGVDLDGDPKAGS